MSYTDVFGGDLIFPSQLSYLLITTAVDVQLQWPTEQQITGGNVVADFMDVNATAPSLNIDMPSALVTGEGNKGTFNNVGANTFTVRDSTGGTIQSIAPGEVWIIVLRDNTTAAGLWRTFQMGASVSVASASALAGAGIKAIGALLNQKIDSDVEAATPFTVVDGDRAKCLIYTAGAGTANLTAAGTLGNDWFVMIRNSGSGTLNIVPPAGSIDGSPSINLDPNDSAFIFTDGTDFFTIGLSSGSTIAFDFVSIPVPGSGDFVLSGANLDRIAYRFTGALTGNRRIVIPNTTQQYWVDNQTTNAFTLEIDTAAGAGQVIPQGQSLIVYCDSVDVINATSSTSVAFPITIGQGGTSATTAAGAIANLGAAADTIDLIAGDGIVGGGDLSGPDRTFDFDLASIAIAVPDIAADFFVFQDVDNADVNAKALLSTIAGLTIEEEGAPLATRADSLDFVGGFVTASGAGADKTITIGAPLILLDSEEIRFGTGNDIQMFFDGSVTLEIASSLAAGHALFVNCSTNGITDIIVSNSVGGAGIRVIAGGDGQISTYSPAGSFQQVLIDLVDADNSVLLRFQGSNAIRTRISSGAYPHNQGGAGTINNNATGNGDARILSWYDAHYACSDLNRARNLVGATPVADDDLVSNDSGAPTLRIGRYKFELFMVVQGNDATTNFIFDFAGTNLSTIAYSWEAESADGTPISRGASGVVATDQTVDLGATINEEIFLRIRGIFDISGNGGIVQFRWAPSASVIDDVTRQAGAVFEINACRIG